MVLYSFIRWSKKLDVIKILKEEIALEKLFSSGNVDLTIVSGEFFEKIDMFEWDEDEKEEFIDDMLGLTPEKRWKIIERMLKVLWLEIFTLCILYN